MIELSFRLEKDNAILLVLNQRALMKVGWKPSLEMCQALDAHIRNSEEQRTNPLIQPLGEICVQVGSTEVAFRQELGKVLCIGNGRLLFDMPTTTDAVNGDGKSIARHVWEHWTKITRDAEEADKAEQVARDAAILHRSGAPFGLTDNTLIQKEAKKLAEGDRDLRRYMVDGIKSAEVLGTPTIFIDKRPPLQQALELAATLDATQLERFKATLKNVPKG
jgi:hypothetical protein